MVSKTFFEINEDHTINQAIVDVDRPAMCTKFRGLKWGIACLHSQVIKNKKNRNHSINQVKNLVYDR